MSKLYTTYECECCGRRYQTEAEANACEDKHKNQRRRSEDMRRETEELNEKIEAFHDKYGVFPILKRYSNAWTTFWGI